MKSGGGEFACLVLALSHLLHLVITLAPPCVGHSATYAYLFVSTINAVVVVTCINFSLHHLVLVTLSLSMCNYH